MGALYVQVLWAFSASIHHQYRQHTDSAVCVRRKCSHWGILCQLCVSQCNHRYGIYCLGYLFFLPLASIFETIDTLALNNKPTMQSAWKSQTLWYREHCETWVWSLTWIVMHCDIQSLIELAAGKVSIHRRPQSRIYSYSHPLFPWFSVKYYPAN